MMKIKLLLILFCMLLFVIGCTQKNTVDPPNNNANEKNTEERTPDAEIPAAGVTLMHYFLPDGSSAHYDGDGNEFAELNIEVAHIDPNYVVIDENNGGALIRKIYEVGDEKIEVLFEDAIDTE